MTTVKRINDLRDYAMVLPYASERFGVYQPLLGWKSKRIEQRFVDGYETDRRQILERITREFAGMVDVEYTPDRQLKIDIRPGVARGAKLRAFDSIVLDRVAARLPPFDELEDATWARTIQPDFIEALLQKDVVEAYTRAFGELEIKRTNAQVSVFQRQLHYESSVAGALLHLVANKQHRVLAQMFYVTTDRLAKLEGLIRRAEARNGAEAVVDIEHLDPRDRAQLESVVLSPIAVVHLFRQYFFELDTFLGPPVSHVWLSPGSSVELLEIHTRRVVVEKTLETSLESISRSESKTVEQEEIAEAVKQNNQRDVKFGASVQASYASIQATSSFDYGNSQQMARETTHKRMREQTETLSTEIRRNFKSTFKTVTETTDVSSTKHTMANSTQELVNYELRRKMRQVGVQVQDIGTFLCWQTYVDDPGRELGVAKLVHIAKPPDLEGLPHPEEIPLMQPFHEVKLVTIPFVSVDGTGADSEGEVYEHGEEVDDSEWFGNLEKIQADFPQQFVCPKPNHVLTNIEFDTQGARLLVSVRGALPSDGRFTLHLDSADFEGKSSLQVGVTLHWVPAPGANDDIVAKNRENLAKFKEAERAAHERAYVETVKDRVTVASKIRTRNHDELRDEERIVVYRKLIHDLLLRGVELPDDRTRHVTAELLDSIFDIDKMLYFVAPEWWRPRMHQSRQQLPSSPPTVVDPLLPQTATTAVMSRGLMKRVRGVAQQTGAGPLSASTVGWGGVHESQRDNYFITDESEPAKLGSSLGWLLQLDGDNMRNAFLNAPWVKAVIPIRPGKEKAAINWLKGVEGMNGITDDVIYHASNPNERDVNGDPLDGQRMVDVLMDLAEKVKRKYQEGIATGKYPKQDEVSDPALVDDESTVTSTPIDRVYEHGFFPLEGSFRVNVTKNYEIFDQWTEILPTDQIVPVEVRYDPKTGRQV